MSLNPATLLASPAVETRADHPGRVKGVADVENDGPRQLQEQRGRSHPRTPTLVAVARRRCGRQPGARNGADRV
jgi:hypothetical protein